MGEDPGVLISKLKALGLKESRATFGAHGHMGRKRPKDSHKVWGGPLWGRNPRMVIACPQVSFGFPLSILLAEALGSLRTAA